MLPITDQMAGPIGLKFIVDTHGWPESVIGYTKFEKNFKFFLHFFSVSIIYINIYISGIYYHDI